MGEAPWISKSSRVRYEGTRLGEGGSRKGYSRHVSVLADVKEC